VRVLHFTDLHLFRPPGLRGLLGKRLLGTSNLYLARRIDHFSQRSIELLVEAIVDQAPDLCVCSGDLTGMASPAEFELVLKLLTPVLDAFPVIMIPGNHDVYTRGAARERRFEAFFGTWSGGGAYPAVHRHGELRVVGLDCARPHPLLASGVLPTGQLGALERLLTSGELADTFNILLLHYPLRASTGEPYGNSARDLANARDVEELLSLHPGIDLILHGHEHHGFEAALKTPHGEIPIHDPGAGGRTWAPQRNETAHFNVYVVDDKQLTAVERWALEDERFVPEAGGPYASGR
jgi:3',5'-cyclic AMP phosphodiesterase CpdA